MKKVLFRFVAAAFAAHACVLLSEGAFPSAAGFALMAAGLLVGARGSRRGVPPMEVPLDDDTVILEWGPACASATDVVTKTYPTSS